MATHVKVVAVLFVVLGVLGLFGAFLSSMAFGLAAAIIGASHDADAALGLTVVGLTGVALTLFLIFASIPSIICGWGLLRLRPWARILGIILGALALIKIPIGTIFGAYVLFVLFHKDSETLFARATLPPAPYP
jgi:hypothetical protein